MEIWLVVLSVLNLLLLVLLVLQNYKRSEGDSAKDLELAIHNSLAREHTRDRSEAAELSRRTREELMGALRQTHEAQVRMVREQLQDYAQRIAQLTKEQEQRMEHMQQLLQARLQQNDAAIDRMRGAVDVRLQELQTSNGVSLEAVRQSVEKSLHKNIEQMERTSVSMQQRIRELQADNAERMERMRMTVDEKLSQTLERRLNASFAMVSERLEQVYKGLGEMQNLANGVGDLKKVLTNVTTRGAWGEMQLGALLEQMLTPAQYDTNVVVQPGATERVEFAVRLPGTEEEETVYLPIDSKFPQEEYQRLMEAQEQAKPELAELAAKRLEQQIRTEAKRISDKYIREPYTTHFAIMFLPVEGLFAEVLRRRGLVEGLQRDFRVAIAGPTTLAALLNSLQMGFRTLAIQKRSSEVWTLLGAVKTEFGKFGDILVKVKKKLDEASNQIDDASRRTRGIERKLRGVEAMEPEDASRLLLPVYAEEEML